MHDLALVEIVQTLQDLDNIAGNEMLVKPAECL